jgi:hypothetical protein
MKCKDCRAYEGQDEEFGFCRRHAPVGPIVKKKKMAIYAFAIVRAEDWCMEFVKQVDYNEYIKDKIFQTFNESTNSGDEEKKEG